MRSDIIYMERRMYTRITKAFLGVALFLTPHIVQPHMGLRIYTWDEGYTHGMKDVHED